MSDVTTRPESIGNANFIVWCFFVSEAAIVDEASASFGSHCNQHLVEAALCDVVLW